MDKFEYSIGRLDNTDVITEKLNELGKYNLELIENLYGKRFA